ncbi:16S rRNA (guanine(527)-N(7))-methyltransferase RsmG [Coraliomargarita akajimensis]|uniref:Ribosomal RNA small subunit methyltransferase G n=1 Tax=Coraliomargarita akajimensis (strain DSM 45221 / IAM 15411 / JCM 23193 / KCTC 12865 / 04OKA010-24) TaxID=583355 RepID=D5EM03_CORAD|nr:16S rRNA (guanine(527)-N(7))-methyltransferase RsmG [Coraliomargarita akajimensis]ADE55163.1 methyltransferase GidB [Coraliomargarita akajimensis DSM 45221]
MEQIRARFPNVDDGTWTLLAEWATLLREWNEKINLISRKDIEHLEERHLAHCLVITNHLRLMNGARIMDVGTGGGFPGLIMAICYPQAQFTLVDSIGKKIGVVADIAERLGLRNVEARQCRAESIRKEFDFITGRAVKNLPEYFSWIKGNLRRGQRNSIPNGVLYWKGGELEPELEALGIRPRLSIDVEQALEDAYFEQKYILHFDARDVPRVRTAS